MVRYVVFPSGDGGGGASASEIWNYTGTVNSGTRGALLLSGGDIGEDYQAQSLGNGESANFYFYGEDEKIWEVIWFSYWHTSFSNCIGAIYHYIYSGVGTIGSNSSYYGVPGSGYDNQFQGHIYSYGALFSSSHYARAYAKNTDYMNTVPFYTKIVKKRWEKFSPRIIRTGVKELESDLRIEEIDMYNDLIGKLPEHRVVMREELGVLRPVLLLEHEFSVEVNEEGEPRRVASYGERFITLKDLREKLERTGISLNKFLGMRLSPNFYGKVSHPEDLGRSMKRKDIEALLEIATVRG